MHLPPRSLTLFALTLLVSSSTWSAEPAAPPALDGCNVVFATPSADASGAVPLGNGSLGASVWLEPSGDLVFYLNHTDSFSEASRLLKIGKVRVHFEPSLLTQGAVFRQELKLRQGRLELNLGASVLNLLVEPNRPVLRVVGRFAAPTTVRVLDEGWRKAPLELGPGHAPESANARVDKAEIGSAAWSLEGAPADWGIVESADVALTAAQAPAAIGWYHRNATSPVARTLKQQGLSGLPGSFDPLLGRTFGAWIDGPGLTRTAEGTLQTTQPAIQLDLRVTSPVFMTAGADEWVAASRTAAGLAPTAEAARAATERHWADFWARSWIFVNGDAASPVPDNHHAVRIGVDSEGGSLFPGALGRVGLYDHALSAAELAQLAAGSPQSPAPLALPGRLLELAAPSPGATRPELTQLPLAKGLTWEAWIRPDENKAGRIMDRMTAGKNDGVLFDTWPGDALRLIVGQRTISAKGVLRAGLWQHVAATYEPATGATALYLDGKEIARQTGDANPLSRGYNLHRYTIACQARGEFAPKFNGGIFTVEPGFADEKNKTLSPDWRRWGDSYWFQNTRLIYHPMIMAGDFDLMEPFWKLYSRPRQLAEARSSFWYQSQGAWIPETMTLFGTYANKDYGWNRDGKAPGQVASPWWHWAWNQTPELIDLLLKRYEWTLDAEFARRELLPQAESLLRYFDTRFRRDDRGILVIDPTQSAETYWNGVVNDLPNSAGLRCILPRLRALPAALTSPAQRALFDRLWAACPEIPVGDRGTKDGVRRVLLPAWKFEEKTNNCENTEQYAIWPFANYAVGKPDLFLGHTTYHVRKFDLPVGWGYDGNAAAMLGMTEEAARILKLKTRNSHPNYRFPATWGPNFDWLPDNCHGGNLMTSTQLMLMQCDGAVIRLLPAWPPEWDVEFKLHAPANTVVNGTVKGGKLVRLDVTPASRLKDVEVMAPFRLP